ncbi:MAG: T9SS type A sorting domain-containing protein [Bacteroidota bacterium]|nr:T9SS type A sorting domain-containing protein [Bacteroidota bacterium]
MKKIILLCLFVVSVTISEAQTATNFTCNDCSGVSHDLFTELDAGKVIVLAWVMPCSACSGPALTAYNAVDGYQASNPGRVFFYLADDYANTSCLSLNGWANTMSIPQNAYSLRFSNAAIDMTDYGTSGMPKIVVIGGSSHTVFYNANNSVNAAAIQNAIDLALSATGITENNSSFSDLNLFPNPADKSSEIKFNLVKNATVTIDLFNLEGKKQEVVFSGQMQSGENKVVLNTSVLPAGMYLVKLTSEGQNRFMNIVVTHD